MPPPRARARPTPPAPPTAATGPITLTRIRAAALRTGPPCSLTAFLAALLPDERQTVLDAFKDHSIYVSTILRVLRERGYSGAGQWSLQRHRREGCPDCGMEGPQ